MLLAASGRVNHTTLTNKQTIERTNKRFNEQTNNLTNERTNERFNKRRNEQTNERKSEGKSIGYYLDLNPQFFLFLYILTFFISMQFLC